MRWILAIGLLMISVWIYLIAPGRSSERARRPFAGRTFAHRGLYAANQSVPENSLAAFLAAVEAGYGIELDVQLTHDGQVIVFHDASLQRVCNVDARPDAFSLDELRKLSLFETGHRIPLLSEVLSLIDGRVPLIVELKFGENWQTLCEKTYALLSGYRGDVCVECFHPLPVRWFYRNAPHVLRGQLSEASRVSMRVMPWYQSIMMSRLLCNCLTHAQFSAYRIGGKCLSARMVERLGAMRVSWTAHADDNWAELMRTSDCIIFEHCRPATHFAKTDIPGVVHMDLEPLIKPIEHITAATPQRAQRS